MSRRHRDDSLIEEIAKDFQHRRWWVGTAFAICLSVVGWFITRLPARGLLLPLLLPLLPWFLWLLALAVAVYTFRGVVGRALDRRKYNRTTDVAELSAYEFERYIGEHFRRRGFAITPRGGRGPDGGVDVLVEKDGLVLIVQCKHWKVWRVGARPVRELWGLVDHENAQGAVVVTSGTFTPEARAFAVGKRLDLIDGRELAKLVDEVKRLEALDPASTKPDQVRAKVAKCPICGSEMVVRTARRGPRAGEQFLGCKRFPACRSMLPLGSTAV